MAMLLWKGGKRPLLFMAFSWKVNQGRHTECMYYYTRTTLYWANRSTRRPLVRRRRAGLHRHSEAGSLLIKLTRKCVLAMNR